MAQQTMLEKDSYLAAFEREYQTTHKVLKAYPPAQHDLKPHERSKSARELGWMLVLNQMVVDAVLRDDLKPGSLPPAPSTWADVVPAFEKAHREISAKLSKLRDDDLNRTMTMPVGPGQVGKLRTGDALWFFLNDTIHHRGQFTVYLRMAGGKVPSIYGPTADEPWF